MKTLKELTNQYSLSKTLRFELQPQGKTLEYILRSGFLKKDQERAEHYQLVKKMIDSYHKSYIEQVLKDFKFKYEDEGEKDSLSEYFLYYHLGNNDPMRSDSLKSISENLRKQLVERLVSGEAYSRIDKKELIKEDLLNYLTSDEDKALVREFKEFTTYFKGFHENRKNMYSDEEKSTSIAYRVVHENLPRFIDNMDVFSKLMSVAELRDDMDRLYKEVEAYLNVTEVSEMFRLSYYSTVITQRQIEVYNLIVGGRTSENGNEKIKGLNEYINLYNQKQKNKQDKLPKLKPLYKQILSEREAVSWLPETFGSDNEMLEAIEKCFQSLASMWSSNIGEDQSLVSLLMGLSSFDVNHIYVEAGIPLTNISQKLYGDWSAIQAAVLSDYVSRNPKKKKETEEKFAERKEKYFKSFGSFPIGYLNTCISEYYKDTPLETVKVEDYFKALGNNQEGKTFFDVVEAEYVKVKDLLNVPYPEGQSLAQDKIGVERIKSLLDAIKRIQHFVKPLLGKGDEPEKDGRFYGELSVLWKRLDAVTGLYNKVRNRMTKKLYSEEKIKLNFENSTLLDGWDLNKESDNLCVILRKDDIYYLAIMDKKHNKVFQEKHLKYDGDCYEKMEYKLLPGVNKMLPKVFFSKSRIDEFAPSQEIMESYSRGTHKKGKNFSLDDCHRLIDFFKSSIAKHEDWRKFGFCFSDTFDYEDLSGFYREVEQQGYMINFRPVSESYIHSLVDEGKIYLFKIYNKDFSPHSKGTPNMHTIYWKMLFDERNLKNVVYKLNGGAEIFYRKSSISYQRPTHPAGQPIINKNKFNSKKESVFDYDLIKDYRYTVDKFQFHVPITLNFKSSGIDNINLKVNDFIRNANHIHVIGIDRGERNLLYLSLINGRGEIIKQFSLNEIRNECSGKPCPPINYRDLLEVREGERDKARKSWKTIEDIKDLKEGYLSLVVHKIAQLVVEYNAIVVLEDLNSGFMRGRQKVERQIYQKFEKMLIEKLNFLVDKKSPAAEPSGALQALQLTNKFVSFQKMGKQSGILFYVPAWNTSKIDPVTGFVNLFNTRYVSKDRTKAFFELFDSIGYNFQKDWFEFEFDYARFTGKAEETRTKWKICTYGTRIRTFRDVGTNSKWASKEVVLSEEFKNLFEKNDVVLSTDMKAAILQIVEASFFKELMDLLRLTLQIRNSRTGTDEDYLLSPVADEQGMFFDSRVCDPSLPQDADANGAYNIARKGLWVVRQIKEATDLSKLKLGISNKEWLKYAQDKPYLDNPY